MTGQTIPQAATIHLDKQTRIIHASKDAQALLGLSDDGEQATFIGYIVRHDHTSFWQYFISKREQISGSFNTTLKTTGNKQIPISINLKKLTNGNRLLRLSTSEPSPQVSPDNSLQTTLLAAQYEQNPGGILLTGPNAEVISFNSQFVQLWRIPTKVAASQKLQTIIDHLQDNLSKPEKFISTGKELCAQPDTVLTGELTLIDGRVLHYHICPIHSHGNHLARSWYFIDITRTIIKRSGLGQKQYRPPTGDNIEPEITNSDAGTTARLPRQKPPVTARSNGAIEIDTNDFPTDPLELHTARDKLQFFAYHDALTNLPNRRLFHDLLDHCLKQAFRNHQRVGVLFLDLDNFKSINDKFGHDAGDEVLIEISKSLRRSLRDSDILCRWGGDEFIIGLPENQDIEGISSVANKICMEVSDDIWEKTNQFQVSLSIGISVYPDHGCEPDLLIRNADVAMYQAKRKGKNRCVLYKPLTD